MRKGKTFGVLDQFFQYHENGTLGLVGNCIGGGGDAFYCFLHIFNNHRITVQMQTQAHAECQLLLAHVH